MAKFGKDSMPDQKHLDSGWAIDPLVGATYHFEHIPLTEAEQIADVIEQVHVVETVNWTLADDKTCHFNKYFAISLSDAVAVAVRLAVNSQEGVAEDVVSIRPATLEEAAAFWKVSGYFDARMPEALSEFEAQAISDDDK